jgi:hypothetical protein
MRGQSWGRPPGLRGSPWTRSSVTKLASFSPSKPTRASAAVQEGDRPTMPAQTGRVNNPPQDDILPYRPSGYHPRRWVGVSTLSLPKIG